MIGGGANKDANGDAATNANAKPAAAVANRNDSAESAVAADARLDRLRRTAWGVGIVALVATFVLLTLAPRPLNDPADTQRLARAMVAPFWRAYLAGFLFWWTTAIGCLALWMITRLVASRWGETSRPYLAAGVRTLPLLAVMFVPIAWGLDDIYLWSRAELVASDPTLQKKAAYLNDSFFLARAVGYFVVWIGGGYWLTRSVVAADRNAAASNAARPSAGRPSAAGANAAGLVLLAFTATFAAIDWAMSLEPHWYSSLYGALVVVGGLLTAQALVIVTLVWRHRSEAGSMLPSDCPPTESRSAVTGETQPGVEPEPPPLADLATMLMALLMLWAYLEFSQYLIVWSANLPNEAIWYLRRAEGGWGRLAVALVVLHFVVPFLLLLSRDVKCRPTAMAGVAGLILATHAMELIWHVAPAFSQVGAPAGAPLIHGLRTFDLVVPPALAGIWIAVYAGQLREQLRRFAPPETLQSSGR